MFLDDPKTRKALSKWAVGTIAACILIFLGVRYISVIAFAVDWLFELIKPLVIGVFAGVAVLVIPELVGAVSVVVSSVTGGLDQLAALENAGDLSELPFAQTLADLDVDWISLKKQLVDWLEQLSSAILNASANVLSSAAASVLDAVVGIVFALYILANREKLLRQLSRLARAWLP